MLVQSLDRMRYQGVHVFSHNYFGDPTSEYVEKLPIGTSLMGCCGGTAPTGTVATETTTACVGLALCPVYLQWIDIIGAPP
jgi:hypothetical protein